MKDEFELGNEDMDFLISHVQQPALIAALEQAKQESHGEARKSRCAIVRLEPNEREAMVDQLGQLLSAIGLEADSEPNATGLRIEALIDVFTGASS